jgi:hypothetical protein
VAFWFCARSNDAPDGLDDPRDPGRIQHTHADMIAFRTLMIADGYEDANDAGALCRDPVFKMALERLPGRADLCSQPTRIVLDMDETEFPTKKLSMGALTQQFAFRLMDATSSLFFNAFLYSCEAYWLPRYE